MKGAIVMTMLKSFDFVFTNEAGEFATLNIAVDITKDGKLSVLVEADEDMDDADIVRTICEAMQQRLKMHANEECEIEFAIKNGAKRKVVLANE